VRNPPDRDPAPGSDATTTSNAAQAAPAIPTIRTIDHGDSAPVAMRS
jgi:hypothetical protein